MDTELLQEFRDGITDFIEGRIPSARNAFLWCANLDPKACDTYRALAVTENDGEGPASYEQVTSMWDNRDSYGKLLTAARLPATHLNSSRDTGMWGITTKLCTKNDIILAYATVLTNAARYDEAEQVLGEATGSLPWTALTYTHLHYVTRRWSDVLSYSESLSTAATHTYKDTITDPPEPDTWVRALSSLMAGEALCHLEHYRAGLERLNDALSCPNEKVAGRAGYIAGLAYRSLGDEKKSSDMLAFALSKTTSPEILHASSDLTARLDITNQDLIEQRADKWNYLTEPSLIEERAQRAHDSREGLLEAANAELASFIGLESVKMQVRKLQAKTQASLARQRKGMEDVSKNHHMRFVGPPGTGKTTIARVVAKIFAGLGIVAEDKFIEASRADFVGNTIGSTAIKTKATIEKAIGGVLFLDEAYALVYDLGPNQSDAFGKEALDVIVAEMENRRDEFVFIIAGYPKDIENLLAVNDGLKSRFSQEIEFPSYSAEELWKIAEVTAKKRGTLLGDGTRDVLVNKISTDMMTREKGKKLIDIAGNGRFIRQVIERAEDNRDLRLLQETIDAGTTMDDLSPEQLATITDADLKDASDTLADQFLGVTRERE